MDLTKLTQKELITLYLKCVKAINRLDAKKEILIGNQIKEINEKRNKTQDLRDEIEKILITSDSDITEMDSLLEAKE